MSPTALHHFYTSAICASWTFQLRIFTPRGGKMHLVKNDSEFSRMHATLFRPFVCWSTRICANIIVQLRTKSMTHAFHWKRVHACVNGPLIVVTVGDQIWMVDVAFLVRGGWERPLPSKHIATWPLLPLSRACGLPLFSDEITRKLVFCYHLQSVTSPFTVWLYQSMCYSFPAQTDKPSFICV